MTHKKQHRSSMIPSIPIQSNNKILLSKQVKRVKRRKRFAKFLISLVPCFYPILANATKRSDTTIPTAASEMSFPMSLSVCLYSFLRFGLPRIPRMTSRPASKPRNTHVVLIGRSLTLLKYQRTNASTPSISVAARTSTTSFFSFTIDWIRPHL